MLPLRRSIIAMAQSSGSSALPSSNSPALKFQVRVAKGGECSGGGRRGQVCVWATVVSPPGQLPGARAGSVGRAAVSPLQCARHTTSATGIRTRHLPHCCSFTSPHLRNHHPQPTPRPSPPAIAALLHVPGPLPARCHPASVQPIQPVVLAASLVALAPRPAFP